MITPEIQKLLGAGLIEDMSSTDYHALKGTFSSSQLKDLLDDEEVFFKKYIEKSIEKESIPAFDIGSYFHTAILEPEKLQLECAVFTGIRRGKEWEKFQIENQGKAIITKSELEQAEGLIKAVKASSIAMNRISRGRPEVSCFIRLVALDGEIYAPDYKVVLGKYGWESARPLNLTKGIELVIKVRADLLASNFILDLKSTTGNAKSRSLMRKKISDYQYDLSAALYLDMFTLGTGTLMDEFVWTFASKDYFNSKSYIASPENILVGRAKWSKAIKTLAFCIRDNWEFEDSMGILEPNPWELEHIKEKAESLL